MTSIELKERYGRLHDKVARMDDEHAEKVFIGAQMWAFGKIAESSPTVAEIWLGKLEAVCWNNYLSDAEAKMIATKLVNQDGSIGAKWSKDAFLQTVEKLGRDIEKEPYYNENALWVTAVMIYSDHAKSIAEDMGHTSPSDIPSEKMALSCYRKAVEQLCDKDRKHFIREYFEGELM